MKTVKISDETHRMLKIVAATNSKSIAFLIEDACTVYASSKIAEKKFLVNKTPLKEEDLISKPMAPTPHVNFAAEEVINREPQFPKPSTGITKTRGELRAEDYL